MLPPKTEPPHTNYFQATALQGKILGAIPPGVSKLLKVSQWQYYNSTAD